MSEIRTNLETLYQRIEAAARRAGRPAEQVTLVAVTKTHPLETVVEAYQAGLRHFGENRVAEGCQKIEEMTGWLAEHPDEKPPRWHFIGHLQSRKAGDVLESRFGLIHSVDSLKLAERLARLARREEEPPAEILLQCNVSGEESKYGFDLNQWSSQKEQLATFLDEVNQIAELKKVVIRGLMTMAPLTDDPETTRPTFRALAALQSRLKSERPDLDWGALSMGMTDDFEVAIEEGATLIRVGRAIFGERNYP